MDAISASTVSEIPDDLILEILKRTSVCTFNSCLLLSRNWKEKISGINSFTSASSEEQGQMLWYFLLFKKLDTSISELGFYQPQTEEFKSVIPTGLCLPHVSRSSKGKGYHSLCLPPVSRRSSKDKGYHRSQVLAGESNGIVCLATEPVTLVDPIKEKITELPLPKTKDINGCVALGYLETLKEYRVIRVVFKDGRERAKQSRVLRFRVGISTTWEFTRLLVSDQMCQGIGISGFVYFLDIRGKIYAYHLESDKFFNLVQPIVDLELERDLHIRHAISLGRRDNQLAVMQVHCPTKTTHIWIKGANTWTHYQIHFPFVSSPSLFLSMTNDTILWWPVQEVRGMVLQKLTTTESKQIRMYSNEVELKEVECLQFTSPYMKEGRKKGE